MTFGRNHPGDVSVRFFVVVTAHFRSLYVFVIMELGPRKIAQFNETDHPIAAWTLQQFREAITGEHPYGSLCRKPSQFPPQQETLVHTNRHKSTCRTARSALCGCKPAASRIQLTQRLRLGRGFASLLRPGFGRSTRPLMFPRQGLRSPWREEAFVPSRG